MTVKRPPATPLSVLLLFLLALTIIGVVSSVLGVSESSHIIEVALGAIALVVYGKRV